MLPAIPPFIDGRAVFFVPSQSHSHKSTLDNKLGRAMDSKLSDRVFWQHKSSKGHLAVKLKGCMHVCTTCQGGRQTWLAIQGGHGQVEGAAIGWLER